ncbi:MAG TPA: hypothetical protein VG900_16585 [Hyphomicrobiaceae bacterium]|nr:hypothetical protein [Hyphomicrobiaceae bacterium]
MKVSRAIPWCAMLVAACSAPKDIVSLTPIADQQAITRDGVPALVSTKRNVVFLRPVASQQGSSERPRFVVALLNRGKSPATFRVADIDVQSTQPRKAKVKVYTHAELAQEVEERRNTALFMNALSGVAGAISASQAGYTHTTGSITASSPYGMAYGTYSGTTYNPAVAQAAANANAQNTAANMSMIEGQAQRMLSQLQATIIKDHTLMPGEWHGGVIVLGVPEKQASGTATYVITLGFDGEQHSFAVSQHRGQQS